MSRGEVSRAIGIERDAPHEPLRRRSLGLLGSALILAGASPKPLVGDANLVDPYSLAVEQSLYGPKPFIALYHRGPYVLGFVAAVHGVDPASKTFACIEQAFDLVKPAALMVEGFPTSMGENWQPILSAVEHRKDPDAAPYTRGEDTYAASIAVERGVPFYGGELIPQELIAGLVRQGFDPQDVFGAQMISQLGVDVRDGVIKGPTDKGFEAAFNNRAKAMRRDFSGSVATDLSSFRGWYERVFGRSIESDFGWTHRADPTEPEVAGQVSKAGNILRDRNGFDLTIRLLNDKHRVLVVYGGSHLSTQWRAFKSALGQPTLIGRS